jgi:peptide/nickel transport system substrate-binding protein
MKTTGITESWEIAPDGLSWTYHIRKGIKFHNGEDLTTADIKFTLEQYALPASRAAFLRTMFDHAEIIDDYTIRIYTKGVQPLLPRYTCGSPGHQGFAIPKDYIERYGMDYFKLHPVGAGPFKFVRHVPGDMFEYEAVDKHFRQTPEFKRLILILAPEESTRLAMMKTGQVDFCDLSVEGAADVEAAGFRTAQLNGSQPDLRFYGSYDPRGAGMPTADVRVRQALSLAINREEIAKALFYGKEGTVMPSTMWENQPEVDIQYWKDMAAKYFRYDLDESKRLLKEAGYSQGFNIKMYSYTIGAGPYLPKLCEIIQGYWLKVGVKAEIVPIDYGLFNNLKVVGADRWTAPELVGTVALNAGDGSPVTITGMTALYWKAGASNLLNGAIPEIDKLFEAGMVEPTEAKRRDIIAKVAQLTADTWVALPFGTAPGQVGLGPRVDITLPKAAMSIAFFADWVKHRKQ